MLSRENYAIKEFREKNISEKLEKTFWIWFLIWTVFEDNPSLKIDRFKTKTGLWFTKSNNELEKL